TAPEAVPCVRRDRRDRVLSAIKSEDVTADLLAPEPVLEFRPKLRRLRAQCCSPIGFAQDVEQFGGSHPRVEGIALQLAERLRPLHESSVGIDHRIARVLPAHVLVTLWRSSLVLLESVAIEITKLVDPFQTADRRGAEFTQQVRITEPLPRLVEHDQV